jgi:hemerythrin-like domain-containing protein
MNELTRYLSDDHQNCDQLFAEAEDAAAKQDWDTARTRFSAFEHATLRHFGREEEVLFPVLEARTGTQGGPTFVMREEHRQMRETISAMAQALMQEDARAYLGLSETLLMLLRQHNLKEEQILYPMADRALSDRSGELISRMDDMEYQAS